MSPTIWTRCAASCRPRPRRFDCVRVVESQFVLSTRKLVDSDEEQALLEAMIDSAKAPVPEAMGGLHYLLFTPFRHPPLRHGSRFGTRSERSLFYGSASISVALAEVAYYRLVFLEGTTASLPLVQTEHTAFTAKIAAKRYLDLTKPPFAAFTGAISSPTDYGESQRLGADLREAGIDAFAFRSARDPALGSNYALFEPVFASKRPSGAHAWLCSATRARVEFKEKNLLRARTLAFDRGTFLVTGKLPSPST